MRLTMLKQALAGVLAAFLIAPAAMGGGKDLCADAIFLGTGGDTTSSGTTAVVVTFADGQQTIPYNPTGTWARSASADEAEWCWSPNSKILTGDFIARTRVTVTSSGNSRLTQAQLGADVDNTVADGDEISDAAPVFLSSAGVSKEGVNTFDKFTLTNGGCVAILAEDDTGSVTLTTADFSVEIEQVRSTCNRN